ncbi:MAG: hypothetical protein LIO93_03380 [Bacteroidales bacterium]|nr:hypothetical protein [Bacteroidales bacterium]
MKEKDLSKDEMGMSYDIDNENNHLPDQPAEEFIGDKADWSKDISEYERKEEKKRWD